MPVIAMGTMEHHVDLLVVEKCLLRAITLIAKSLKHPRNRISSSTISNP